MESYVVLPIIESKSNSDCAKFEYCYNQDGQLYIDDVLANVGVLDIGNIYPPFSERYYELLAGTGEPVGSNPHLRKLGIIIDNPVSTAPSDPLAGVKPQSLPSDVFGENVTVAAPLPTEDNSQHPITESDLEQLTHRELVSVVIDLISEMDTWKTRLRTIISDRVNAQSIPPINQFSGTFDW